MPELSYRYSLECKLEVLRFYLLQINIFIKEYIYGGLPDDLLNITCKLVKADGFDFVILFLYDKMEFCCTWKDGTKNTWVVELQNERCFDDCVEPITLLTKGLLNYYIDSNAMFLFQKQDKISINFQYNFIDTEIFKTSGIQINCNGLNDNTINFKTVHPLRLNRE